MSKNSNQSLTVIAYVLVLLMVLLQGAYAVYAYVDPAGFAVLRGTNLFSDSDADWVKIYASRTLFVALIVGSLLYFKNYRMLIWAALFGTVMPLTDALLAFQAQAADQVLIKHVATVVYLLVTAWVLWLVVKRRAVAEGH